MKDNNDDDGPTLPRGFTPTEEQLKQAIAIVMAGMSNGFSPTQEPGQEIHTVGPGALVTGHGLASGGRKVGPPAYEVFIDSVKGLVGPDVWSRVSMETQSAWVKFEGPRTRERLYVARSVTSLSRIHSTLSPEVLIGAAVPDKNSSAGIRSWIIAEPHAVAHAIKLIAGD